MLRVPPGRAGQVWLRRRLNVARRGADVLSRKQQLLSAALLERASLSDAAREAWLSSARLSQEWSWRALELGHHRQMALIVAQLDATAGVEVGAENILGVRIPGETRATFPDASRAAFAGGTSAIDASVAALMAAVEAAARHAAIERATHLLETELNATRRRLRLLERRRLPQLEQALRESSERLEEVEREDTARLRWARGSPHERRREGSDHKPAPRVAQTLQEGAP